jgi:colicin import membrane protein
MNTLKEKYGLGFIISFVIHGILIVLLVINVHSTMNPSSLPPTSGEVVQASVVDEKQVVEEVKRLQIQDNQKKGEEQKKVDALNQQAHEAAALREKEQKKIAKLKYDLEKAKIVEQEHLAEIRLAKEKERKELEVLKKAKEKEVKRLAALDERRQEEQDRTNQMRLEREKEEKKRAGLVNVARRAEEDKRSAALNAVEPERQSALDAQHQRNLNAEIDQHTAMIREKINQSWIRTPGMPEGLSCVLEIQTFPDGNVKDVKVVQPSENEAFNQSAQAAVFKATPLPMPQGEVSDRFRHFEVTFAPKS